MESTTRYNTPGGDTTDIDIYPEISTSTSTPTSAASSSSNEGSLAISGNYNYTRLGLITVILLFLGINIFSYLGDFLQKIKELLAPFLKNILESVGYVVTEGTKDATQIAAEGAKLGIDVAAGTVTSGIDVIQGQLDIAQSGNKMNGSNLQKMRSSGSSTTQSVNGGMSTRLPSALADADELMEPIPDDSMSSTQRLGSGKSGYCYIGEDRGFRSCIYVSENDTCMSGEIFPTQNICVNPSLRE